MSKSTSKPAWILPNIRPVSEGRWHCWAQPQAWKLAKEAAVWRMSRWLLSCAWGPSWFEPHWTCDCSDFQAWLLGDFYSWNPDTMLWGSTSSHREIICSILVLFKIDHPVCEWMSLQMIPAFVVGLPPSEALDVVEQGQATLSTLSKVLAHRAVNIMKWSFYGTRFGMVWNAAVIRTLAYHVVVNVVTWCYFSPEISIKLPKCLNHCVWVSEMWNQQKRWLSHSKSWWLSWERLLTNQLVQE